MTPAELQHPLPAALEVLRRWAPTLDVEAAAGRAPIQWLNPWDEVPSPERTASYGDLDPPPKAVTVLPRDQANRFAVTQPARVDALAEWLTARIATLLPPPGSHRVRDLLTCIADLMVTWIAVDPDILLLTPADGAVHLLHRTGDRTTRFSFIRAEEPPPTSPVAVADLLSFLLPVTPTRGVRFALRPGPVDVPGLHEVDERTVYESLCRAAYLHATAIGRPGLELARLAVRLVQDVLDTALATAGPPATWHAANVPERARFTAEGTPGCVVLAGPERVCRIDIGFLSPAGPGPGTVGGGLFNDPALCDAAGCDSCCRDR
ncbi:hypothetical protein [Dactylosporangium sp. CA-233914]|uniref:hypothetical protein n=1 Tax=Dactylosporangium sp. CA-233914 TaxID=3239934 RepID=UPI003D913DCC